MARARRRGLGDILEPLLDESRDPDGPTTPAGHPEAATVPTPPPSRAETEEPAAAAEPVGEGDPAAPAGEGEEPTPSRTVPRGNGARGGEAPSTRPDRAPTPPAPPPDVWSAPVGFPDRRATTSPEPRVRLIDRMDRKELFVWPDQVDHLAELARYLNRQRGRGQGQRITPNTLVRIAIDHLLATGGALSGRTENELRRSVGLPPRPEAEPVRQPGRPG